MVTQRRHKTSRFIGKTLAYLFIASIAIIVIAVPVLIILGIANLL